MSELITDYKTIYKKIMDTDPLIRFATIIDSKGMLMHGGQREGVRSYLSPQNQKKSLRQALDAWSLRERFSEQIGKGKYAFAEYENIKRITIPLDFEHLIYITTEIKADHTKIIEKILKVIKE